MRTVRISSEMLEISFAQRAALHFAKYPEHTTYTDGEIVPGCLFAMLSDGGDSVIVMRLSSVHEPTEYINAVANYLTTTERSLRREK